MGEWSHRHPLVRNDSLGLACSALTYHFDNTGNLTLPHVDDLVIDPREWP
jgi:hypothetical protein